MRICYILAYRDPQYIRTVSLLTALESIPNVKIFRAINRSRGLFRYIETLIMLLRIRRDQHPDIYILGFRGHEMAWLIRRLTQGRPLIFDALMSPYAALTEERKAGFIGSLIGRLWKPCEKSALRSANLVLTDTYLHAEFLAKLFDLPMQRIFPVPVGAVELPPAFHPTAKSTNSQEFRVLFYGSFLPLHGIDIIVRSAALVKDLPVFFEFIGGDRKQIRKLHALCSQLGVSKYEHQRWSPLTELLTEKIPKADLCLGGPFGNTPQSQRVFTTKSSQCLALGKATVIGSIKEDIGLIDRVNCLLTPQADAQSLASAIRWSYENRNNLAAIGQKGMALYQNRLSQKIITTTLTTILKTMHRNFN